MSSCVVVGLELVSGAEIGRRLGVSREAVRLWREQPDFPEPISRVGRSVVWDWALVEKWAKKRGRQPDQARRREEAG
ncbi:MAG TPA: hypothetical protein VMF65_23770 [Acidimicrobiales bacterium]|nr:hypothetical protein [Acidimicrobiales bacterium]